MSWLAKVHLQTTDLRRLQVRKRRQSTLSCCVVARRLPQMLLRCGMQKAVATASIVRSSASYASSVTTGRGSRIASVIRIVGNYPIGLIGFAYCLSGTSSSTGV